MLPVLLIRKIMFLFIKKDFKKIIEKGWKTNRFFKFYI